MKATSRTLATAVCGLLTAAAAAHSQTRWTVDSKASLAWWQVNPHLNDLWATTCPREPSWRPGEGRIGGWNISPKLRVPRASSTTDTVNVPLFPRGSVSPICVEAVRGDVIVQDTVHWRGVRGMVAVQGAALVTGGLRDPLMHRVLETGHFPEIQFAVDSLVDLTALGDTLVGRAPGTLTIRGVPTITTATVKLFRDAGGIRVLARLRMPADTLFKLTPRLQYVSLANFLWKDFFMGADLVFRPAPMRAND